MKSPCHDCEHKNTDKNNSICLECDARVKYAQGVVTTWDPTIKIEKRGDGMSYKKGTCNNCERPDMYLPGHKRCWMCYDAGRQAEKNGASIEEALAAVKERVKSGVKLKSKYRTKNRGQLPGTSNQKPSSVTQPIIMIALGFSDSERDRTLLSRIEKRAAEDRRTIDQQILWMLSEMKA